MAAMLAAMSFVGCNSNTYEAGEDTASSVAIYSFSLSKDDSILANLDTVFFSIDLNRAEIFNADSLPYGTKVNKLVPVIRMLDNVSKAELKFRNAAGRDTVYDYITNSSDTVDFSHGPAYFTVASPDGTLEMTYTIKVNVHKLVSDSLFWSETARTGLPTKLSSALRQRTTKIGNTTYCLTTDNTAWSMAKREGAEGEWSTFDLTMPADAAINEFTSSSDALYIISGANIYTSVDEGETWSDTGVAATHLYGGYGSQVLYAVNDNGSWFTGSYPGGAPEALPEGMPVSGTSQLVNFTFPLAGSVMAMMVGGSDVDDILTNATWAYDGTNWAKISVTPIPEAYEGMTLVPFFVYTVSNAFVATQYSIVLAFGGRGESTMNETVYISGDCGRTWRTAGQLLQLPSYFPVASDAQAFVETLTLGSRSSSQWLDFTTERALPANAEVLPPFAPQSRATEPVTTWECPYIYYYGGMVNGNTLSPYIWRGTINRMTFKPII